MATTLVHALWYAPDDSGATPAVVTATPAVDSTADDYPVRLVVPTLAIDAAVQRVGITKKGSMGVPSNFTDVAWYRDGVTPGQYGSAVIDGHVDNGLGLSGVFKHLPDLAVGDSVYVVTVTGKRLHFVVDAVKVYSYEDVPADVFAQSDVSRLNLITCEGKWVPKDRTYDHRLVVFTSLRE